MLDDTDADAVLLIDICHRDNAAADFACEAGILGLRWRPAPGTGGLIFARREDAAFGRKIWAWSRLPASPKRVPLGLPECGVGYRAIPCISILSECQLRA